MNVENEENGVENYKEESVENEEKDNANTNNIINSGSDSEN